MLWVLGPSAENGGFVFFRGCDWYYVDSLCFWECFIWSDGQDCKCVIVFLCVCVFVDYGDGGVVAINYFSAISLQLWALHRPPPLAGKSVNVELSGQEGLSIHRKHKTSTAWFSCCISVPVTHGKNPSLSTATKGKRLIHQTTFYKQQMLHQNSKQTQIRPLWVSLRPGWLHAN